MTRGLLYYTTFIVQFNSMEVFMAPKAKSKIVNLADVSKEKLADAKITLAVNNFVTYLFICITLVR